MSAMIPSNFAEWKALRSSIRDPVSILMPSYNEAQAIETVVANFEDVVLHHLPAESEFVIEDSGSTDGTREILVELQKRWPNIRLSLKEKREGIPAALRSLIRQAKCPWIFLVDSDGQSLAAEFWKLTPLMATHDFILGRRTVRHDALHRRWGSSTFTQYCVRLFNLPVTDINAAFRLCRSDLMKRCAELYETLPNAFFAETTIWAHTLGARLGQTDVVFGPRLHGESHAFESGTQWRQYFEHFAAAGKLHKRIHAMRKAGEIQPYQRAS